MTFSAGPVPKVNNPDVQEALNVLWQKLQELEDDTNFFHIEESNAAPDNPTEEMIVFADGTNWDPGSGRGLYRFNGTTWEAL